MELQMIKLTEPGDYRGWKAISAIDDKPIDIDRLGLDDRDVIDTLTIPDFMSAGGTAKALNVDNDMTMSSNEANGEQIKIINGKPLVFIDFDGVINAFPEDKVWRRGGQTGRWLASRPDSDYRKKLYSLDHAFHLDASENITLWTSSDGGLGQTSSSCRIHFSRELAKAIYDMQTSGEAEVLWLSTWQPWTGRLALSLGWNDVNDTVATVDTVRWYDPSTGIDRAMGKLFTIAAALEELKIAGVSRRIVWIDDEEANSTAVEWLESHGLGKVAPVLMIQPDERIGASRSQWDHVKRFVNGVSGEDEHGFYADRTPFVHHGHIGL